MYKTRGTVGPQLTWPPWPLAPTPLSRGMFFCAAGLRGDAALQTSASPT